MGGGAAPLRAAQDDQQPQSQGDYSRGQHGAVRSTALSVKAVSAALDGKFEEAERLAAQSGDSVAAKVVEWINLRDNWPKAGYERLMAFIARAPGWPHAVTMRRRAEYVLFSTKAPADAIERHFAGSEPLSPEGHIALARAALARGDKALARRQTLAAWLDTSLGKAGRDAVITELSGLLQRSDHEQRLWRLIHAQETEAAVATAGLVSPDHVAAAKCARALIRVEKSGLKLLNALPAGLRNSQALQYALARYHRRTDNPQAALAILLKTPDTHAKLIDAEAWWIERRLVARMLLGPGNRGHWGNAYKLARAHGYEKGPHFEEGEFLAGWIALRMLGDARTAVAHFSRIPPVATSRTQEARGAYWEGRAWLELGDKAKADAAFRRAAATPTVYYGLLAREALGLGDKPIAIATGNPSAALRKKVASDELMRAFLILADAGGDSELHAFAQALGARFRTADEAATAASLIAEASNAHIALRFAKAASSQGIDIDDWNYPIRAIPAWKGFGSPVEKALVYGLSRQESEFNSRAMSRAGARGLMQLMPGTARIVAKQFRLDYSEKRLTSDPAYNLALGAAHLGDLIGRYNGSYILTFAGYNAGPSRAQQWINQYGDPRDAHVDPIDWVESIPFTETRTYIQKVLQNVHVYRSRLAPRTMVPMRADLARGAAKAMATGDHSDKAKCGKGGATSIAALIQSC
jgi:soluble lytic murein transglycosylase